MTFDNIPPKWDAEGTEPSEALKTRGFTAGYKPPASIFNYLFNKITACVKELQTKLKGVSGTTDKLEKNAITSVGTEIPENSDLNAYISDGVYYSSGAATSATLGNAPFTTCGFRLMVFPTIAGNGYKKQIVLPSGKHSIAVRSYYNAEFTDWLYIESVGELSDLLTDTKTSVVNAINELVKNTYNLSGGTKILEGANLNEYKEVGNYYCNLNKTAETLVNSPTNSAFKMKVALAAGSNYPSQEITIYNTGVKYYRWFNTETNSWSDFRVFAETGDLSNLTTSKKGNLVAAINEINEFVKWLNANGLKSLGADIPASADLDQYTTFGVFRAPSAAISSTLNKTPYTGCGFRLVVFPTISLGASVDYVKQIVIPSATNPYAIRTKLPSGWTEWRFIGDVVDNLESTADNLPLSAKQGNVLKEKINMFLKTDNFTIENISINAQSDILKNIDVGLDGYTPISLKGWAIENGTTSGANANKCHLQDAYFSLNTFYYRIANTGASGANAKVNLVITVLYAKNN